MPTSVAPDCWFVDLHYMDAPNLIAAGVMESEDGLLVVDPGPTTALDTLTEGLAAEGFGWDDVHALLLTHIHLDHAGASGSIVAAAPHVQVYVHRRGALHLENPRRLLKSARRIYGDRMDALWGDVAAVPAANLHALAGGETLQLGRRTIQVAYTPGHAVHHISFLDEATGTAWVGDVAGMRVAGADYVLPVAPPPDIDLDAWTASLETLHAWRPERLFITHCGAFDDVARHLDEAASRLNQFARDVQVSMQSEMPRDAAAEDFHAKEVAAMKNAVPEPMQPPYEHFGRPEESWHGLARYWKTRS